MLRTIARTAYTMLHPNGVSIMVNGTSLRVSAMIARGVRPRIEADTLPTWLEAARGAHCVIDAGANVGVWSALTARVLTPGGTVHAFEPAPRAFTYLTDTARVALGPAAIVPIHSALGDHEGTVSMTIIAGSAPTNHLATDGQGTPVPMTTIDAYCARLGLTPNAIKIDVEGAELLVLRGAMNTLRTQRPLVVLELHWLPEMGVTPDAALRLFDELGYVAHEPVTDTAVIDANTLRRINGVVLKPVPDMERVKRPPV
jgi:FkbM family methyltransferase